MKKLMILLLVVGSAVTAKSQNVSFGPSAGFGHSWISDVNGDKKFMPSYNAGLTLVYSTKTNWGFGADVKYSGEGVKVKSGTGDDDVTTRLNYIRVPLKAIYFFGQYGQKVRPKVAFGPTLGFLTNAKTTTDINGQETEVDIENNIKGFDIGLQGSVGLNFRLAPNTWLNTDLSYYHGLNDITKSASSDIKNRNLGINVGVAFGIGTIK